MEWYEYLADIAVGIIVLTPLVIKLVQYVTIAIKERNWPDLVDLVMKLMSKAETKFATGAERKEWVLTNVKAAADKINYNIDYDAVGEMIDSFCALTKKVNPPESESEPAAADIKPAKSK